MGLDGRVVGMIDEAGDVDCYPISLEGKVVYRVDMEGNWNGNYWGPDGNWVAVGTLFDPQIDGLYDSDGNLVPGTDDPEDDNRGTYKDAQMSFSVETTGRIFAVCRKPRIMDRHIPAVGN